MKKILLLLLLCSSLSFAQTSSNFITDNKDRKVLWGEFEMADLTRPAFNDWFQSGYEAYQPDQQAVNQLKSEIGNYQIEVYMGTWCGDSKREVPRLINLFGEIEAPKENVRMVAIRGDNPYYKQGPKGETMGKNIHRVPTISISKNGQEIGRIVEEPMESLEADLLNIIQGDYKAQYPLANAVGALLDKDLNWVANQNELQDLQKQWQSKSDSFYELNTLAFVLSTQKREQQALSVLKLNGMLFPKEAQVHYRLGKKLEELEQFKEAALSYAKALELKPEIEDYALALKRVQGSE